MVWRHPGLAVTLTAASLPLVLLLPLVATWPFGNLGAVDGVDRPTSVVRHAGERTVNPMADRVALAAAPRTPDAAWRRLATRPRIAFACETPRQVAASVSVARTDGRGSPAVGAPRCVPDAPTARAPAWQRAPLPPSRAGPPVAPRTGVARAR